MNTPLDFPGDRRIHLGLAVSDIARSRPFYELLLGVSPAKERPGYCKFTAREPALNLALNAVGDAIPAANPATHFGIEVRTSEAVEAAAHRLESAGLATRVERATTCCYAVQDKVWATDPDGHRWEIFVVLDADAPRRADDATECCPPTCCSEVDTEASTIT